MAFSANLKDYVDVAARIAEFTKDYPTGVIQTFIRHMEGPEVVFEARVYRTPEDVKNGVYTSGFAREVEGKSPVNKTSHVENSETSAIGRALANMAYGTKTNRASRSEMLKVARMTAEHEAMIEFITANAKKLKDEELKDTMREGWDEITEQYRVARDYVELIEKELGIEFKAPTPPEA